MVVLSALPSELLLSIFSACDIQATIRMSATCKRLRQIWLEYNEEVVEANLGAVIVDFEGAKRLAIDEARLLPPTATDPSPPPVHLWLPRLLENAALASNMLTLGHECRFVDLSDLSERDLTSAYYILRRLLLSYTYQGLRAQLYRELLQATEDSVHACRTLRLFVFNFLSPVDMERHGMLKDWSLYDPQPPDDSQPWLHDEWQWSRDVIDAACEQWDRPEERGTLKRALCPDPILSHLPTELVLSIFGFCGIKDAVRLSSTCHYFRQIWFQNTDGITRAILIDDLEDFEGAKKLAITEAQLLPPTATNTTPPSISLWLPHLVENWALASELNESFAKRLYLKDLSLTRCELFTAYHFFRQLRLAYNYPELRSPLRQELEAASRETLEFYGILHSFMYNFMNVEHMERHGMVYDINLEDPLLEGPEADQWLNEDWRFALDEVFEACF